MQNLEELFTLALGLSEPQIRPCVLCVYIRISDT